MGKNPEKTSVTRDDIQPLCPVYGRELDKAKAADGGGWNCKCGEFIPEGTQVSPFSGSSDRLTGKYHKRINR